MAVCHDCLPSVLTAFVKSLADLEVRHFEGRLFRTLGTAWVNRRIDVVRQSAGRVDGFECLLEVVGEWVGGRDRAGAGLDLDRAEPAGGADELADGPAGSCLDPAGDGKGGEDDGGVGLDRLARLWW